MALVMAVAAAAFGAPAKWSGSDHDEGGDYAYDQVHFTVKNGNASGSVHSFKAGAVPFTCKGVDFPVVGISHYGTFYHLGKTLHIHSHHFAGHAVLHHVPSIDQSGERRTQVTLKVHGHLPSGSGKAHGEFKVIQAHDSTSGDCKSQWAPFTAHRGSQI